MPRSLAAIVLLGLIAFSSGCSRGKCTISGRVTLEGRPLPAGVITFHCQTGNREVVNAKIQDGNFSVDDVPIGPVKITVTPIPSQGDKGADQRQSSGGALPVPNRYRTPEESLLQLEVKGKSQQFNVDLTP
jgi:hypothetical protein